MRLARETGQPLSTSWPQAGNTRLRTEHGAEIRSQRKLRLKKALLEECAGACGWRGFGNDEAGAFRFLLHSGAEVNLPHADPAIRKRQGGTGWRSGTRPFGYDWDSAQCRREERDRGRAGDVHAPWKMRTHGGIVEWLAQFKSCSQSG